MARQWFYAHSGQTLGPVSARQLKYLAATGGLQPEDLIWPEQDGPDQAVVAGDALDFAALRRLAQKARAGVGARKVAPPADELSEWLDAVGGLFRDPEQAVGPVPDWLQPPGLPGTGAAPDWLSEVEGAAPAPEPEATEATTAEPAEVPIAPPVAAPVGAGFLERIGIDPVAERVVDWAKLKKWLEVQMQQRPGELPVPAESDPDPFQTARKQLAAWFDLPKNRDRLACGELSALRQDPVLLEFMKHFERYGREKQARLWEFVDFLIDTRLRNPPPFSGGS